MPEIAFYISRECLPSSGVARAWKNGEPFQLESEGPVATEQAWVYQTYVRLRERGVPCRLVHKVPEAGVLVAFVGAFDPVPAPLRDDVFFVCVAADAVFHPFANWHVVQNPRQARCARNATFLPHWPQPALQPRDPARGRRFENVHYYGHAGNLAPELRSRQWRERLRAETGLRFRVRGPDKWHDYRDADAVVAVRSFGARVFPRKPATKLYNAWLAGVPALCGRESALRAERRTERDYLEVASPEELLRELRFLKEHPAVVDEMRAQAARRAQARTVQAVRERWRQFFASVVQPEHERWQHAGALRRNAFYFFQRAKIKGHRHWSQFLGKPPFY